MPKSAAAQQIVQDVWKDKYAYKGEQTQDDSFRRIAGGVYAKDTSNTARLEALEALLDRTLVPAGRIQAGAGTDKRVTLINCFVSPKIQDSMDQMSNVEGTAIMDSLKIAALTQQMGGGIGMDFSTIRPKGAIVKRTGSVSSGILPFMDMWHAMCGTVMSSGSRRGAMMGTLAIWHPDVLDFISAKRTDSEKGDYKPGKRLKNFNVSVLVTDAFMECLEKDLDWDLYFTVPRADGQHEDVYERNGETHYVYQRIKARDLWSKIINNTYVYAEPGVIFIDRVNKLNNLAYCEQIHCTNPCGEQPLPPNGDCNLGHVNLAMMVKNPFTPGASFDFDMLKDRIRLLVRFLDNVLDITQFPTLEQEKEAQNKRRTGIGYTGLANALQQLRIAYGSPMAIEMTKQIGRAMRDASYRASVELARERGSFPLFKADEYCERPFIKTLPQDIQDDIRKYGIRNAILMSLAPTGTTSITAGNVSSGIEPVFLHEADRKVLQPDGISFEKYSAYDYGYLAYHEFIGQPPGSVKMPEYFVTADQLTVDQHLQMMAAAQEFVDASISKTINCPTSMTIEDFQEVYSKAYQLGLKGCTTYRYDPRSERGEVLSAKAEVPLEKIPMQEVAEGRRYRVKWPNVDTAFYIVITDYVDAQGNRRPFELFIMSKSAQHEEWMKALSLLITAIFRRGGNVAFIVEELKQVYSAGGGMWTNKSYVNSIVAAIGLKIEEHFRFLGLIAPHETIEPEGKKLEEPKPTGLICVACSAPAVIMKEGCKSCTNCGWSNCS